MFTNENPAGDVTDRVLYRRVLISLIIYGISTSFKRVWVGQHLGRRIFVRYNPSLIKLMKRMMLVSEVALLAKKDADTDNTDRVFLGVGPVGASGYLETDEISARSEEQDFREHSTFRAHDSLGLLDDWEDPFGDVNSDENEKEMVRSTRITVR